MSTKTFHRLRYFTQIILPAMATFLITLGGTWNIEIGVQVGTTISAVITLLSGIMGASSAIYDKERESDDGTYNGDINSYVHISCRSVTGTRQDEEGDANPDVTGN